MMGLPISRPRRALWGAIGLLAAAGALGAQPAHAQQVFATYYTGGGGFFYNLSVRNNTTTTLADVTINLPTNATASNFSAPLGFQFNYDPNGNGPNMGVVDLFPTGGSTRDFFAGTTVSGFLFRSTTQLNGATFTSLNAAGSQFNGTIVTTAGAAPEPGSFALLAFAAAPAFALVARRRARAAASLKG